MCGRQMGRCTLFPYVFCKQVFHFQFAKNKLVFRCIENIIFVQKGNSNNNSW